MPELLEGRATGPAMWLRTPEQVPTSGPGAVRAGPSRPRGRLLAGAVIALLLVLPDLWWQVRHGWAMFEMTRALNGEHGGPGNILTWIVGQLSMSSLAMTALWVVGLRFLWRSGRPLWRCLVTAYAVLFVLFAVTTGAQVYHLGGLYVCLLAAGAVGLDGWLHSRPDRLRGLMTVTAVSAALSAVTALPGAAALRRGLDVRHQPDIGGRPWAGPNWSAPCGRCGPGSRPDSV